VPQTILIGIGLILLTLVVYYPALEIGMVADDFRIVRKLNFSDALRALHETVGYGRNEYRPLIAFSYAFSNSVWNGNLRGYHLDSILLHSVNVVLLFAWLWLLTRSATISAAAAVLFAAHPIHHARVVWIAARDSLISTLFILLALIAYTLVRRGGETGSPLSPARARLLAGISIGCFFMSLISYEGSAIVPGILAGLELFVFARPVTGVCERLRNVLVRTLPYTIVLLLYLAWWILQFRGEVGRYELSYSPMNLWRNYCSLLYQLFWGHQRLAGCLYFVIALMGLLLPRDRRPLVWFSLLFLLVAFLPFVTIAGFAGRFAYTSAIGYALLIALLVSAWAFRKDTGSKRALRLVAVPLAAVVFFSLAGYYLVDLRARISEWKTAGEIAESIPRQIKTLYPELRTDRHWCWREFHECTAMRMFTRSASSLRLNVSMQDGTCTYSTGPVRCASWWKRRASKWKMPFSWTMSLPSAASESPLV
jgi:hypothetical protein